MLKLLKEALEAVKNSAFILSDTERYLFAFFS